MIPSSVHAQVLGSSFDRLPPLLKSIHDGRALKQYAGRCSVSTGRGWIAWAISRVASLPRAHSDIPVTVIIERSEVGETWTRRFGEHQMRSVIRAGRGGLEERFGPIVLTFELVADGERIVWLLRRAHLLFLPLPLSWFSGCGASETISEGRYCFDARAQISGIGLLVHYKGWLVEHAR